MTNSEPAHHALNEGMFEINQKSLTPSRFYEALSYWKVFFLAICLFVGVFFFLLLCRWLLFLVCSWRCANARDQSSLLFFCGFLFFLFLSFCLCYFCMWCFCFLLFAGGVEQMPEINHCIEKRVLFLFTYVVTLFKLYLPQSESAAYFEK